MNQNKNDNQCQFRIFKKGEGKRAILILHGFTAEVSRTDIIFDFFAEKGYTVARPILPGHSGTERDKEVLVATGPEDWLNAARAWLEFLCREAEEVYILGISFGGNLGASLCAECHAAIKGLVLMEMPVFFNLRMWLVINFLQPLVELAGIDFIKKNSLLYRRRYERNPDRGTFNFIPVKAVGRISRYIKNRTKSDLAKVCVPTLILHAQKSDLLNNHRNAEYIHDRLAATHKKIHTIPINNHDLNLLDDVGKIVMLERIYKFVEGI